MQYTPHPYQPYTPEQRRHDIDQEIRRILHGALPPPSPDTPEARAHDERLAFAEVAAMEPATTDEASMATRCVLTLALGRQCLRLADQHAGDSRLAGKLRARAAMMERAAHSTRRLLLRIQKTRRKREADPVTREQDRRTQETLRYHLHQALERMYAGNQPPAALPRPALPSPAREPVQRLDLRLWQAHLHAGPPIPIDRIIH